MITPAKDSDGNVIRDDDGKTLVTSTNESDSRDDKTVYKQQDDGFGSVTETDHTYNPQTGKLDDEDN